jgi:cytoskeletal protein CcmA (bactofilin family)
MALFGSDKEHPMSKQANASLPGQINMIGEGTVFEGTLRARSDVRVSGRIVGKLHVDGKAIVTQEGAIEGEVIATSADVAGTVQGDLHVTERLVLKGSAHVEGNVRTGHLVVEEGAVLNGKCAMGEQHPARPEKLEPNGTRARGDVSAPAP